jgi:hypothetical protein
LAFSYWIDNLGFITEGKLAAIFIKPSLEIFNWSVIYFINYTPSNANKFSGTIHHRAFTDQIKKKRTGGQDASRCCARRLGGPDRDPFSVRTSMQTVQNGSFTSAGCIGQLLIVHILLTSISMLWRDSTLE